MRRELRDAVLFTNHSVLRYPPFSRLDLISCRNLLIYLQREMQQNVFEIFHYALAPVEAKVHQEMLEEFAPPSVLVDETYRILHKFRHNHRTKVAAGF